MLTVAAAERHLKEVESAIADHWREPQWIFFHLRSARAAVTRAKNAEKGFHMAARRRRATVRLFGQSGRAHHYGAKFAGYGHKPALAPVKSAKKSLTKTITSVRKAAPSRAKTVAVAKVRKARTAVKTAEHAVARVRKAPVYRAKRGAAYASGYGTPVKHRGRPRRRVATTRTLAETIERMMRPVGVGRGRRKRA